MATSLFPPGFPPTWQVPQALLRRRPNAPPAYPQSYSFDPVTGDFALDGAGRVPHCSGRAAAAQRAAKAASTQQGAYTKIYRRGFGADLEPALRGGTVRPVVERALADTIRRAVQRRDRRARDIEAVSFEWANVDSVTAIWTLVLSDGTRVRQEVPLS